jgi:hypothetical protein
MGLNYQDFSGFFPFNIMTKQSWDAAGLTLSNSCILSSVGLAQLVKLYWLSKSFDWSFNLAYNYSFPGAVDPSEIGTITGSGTSVLQLSGPGSRTAPPFEPFGSPLAVTSAGSFAPLSPGQPRPPFSTPSTLTLGWVMHYNVADFIGVVAKDFTASSSPYLSLFQIVGQVGGAPNGGGLGVVNGISPVSEGAVPGPFAQLVPGLVQLTADGVPVPSSSIPLLVGLSSRGVTGAMSGSIIINFNSFYSA